LAIRSPLRRFGLEAAWAFLAVANVLVPRSGSEWKSVPFQLAWAAVTLLYLAQSRRAAFLVAMSLVTAGELAWTAMHEEPGLEQLSELPLMVILFAAVVWFAARQQARTDALRAAAEHEREFLRDASHQLRTPITIARGHVELIRDAALAEETAADADVVLEALDRLSRLSDRLLLLAAAETPSFLSFEPLELERVVGETARRWRAAADRHWVVETTSRGVVVADRERLATALDALIENAVKFTSPDDTITIAAGATGSRAVLEIHDTGAGIAEWDLGRIFGRFVRGTVARTAGTGLGLAIVQAIVAAHGGAVAVSSTARSGTRFRVELPRFTANAPELRHDSPMTVRPVASEAAAS
jgi:signal transduction histidine kinase